MKEVIWARHVDWMRDKKSIQNFCLETSWITRSMWIYNTKIIVKKIGCENGI
jgi:hypothetical protein